MTLLLPLVRRSLLRQWSRSASSGRSGLGPLHQQPKHDYNKPLLYALGAGGLTYCAALSIFAWNDNKPTAADASAKATPRRILFNHTPALSVLEADQALRAASSNSTGAFTVAKDKGGIWHSAQYASNSPCEDESTAICSDQDAYSSWGVFDGHAGWATSRLIRGPLVVRVTSALQSMKSLATKENVFERIRAIFLEVDEQINYWAIAALTADPPLPNADVISALAPAMSGSCALVATYNAEKGDLYVACTGDSRAVLGNYNASSQTYAARAMSEDQNGFNAAERDRIAALHPGEADDIFDLKQGRIMGLMVLRAFGDHRWKWPIDLIKKAEEEYFGPSPRPKYKTPPYLTAEPVITHAKIERCSKQPSFLILASDGLWDHLSSEHAVECVSQWLADRAGTKTPVANSNGYPPPKMTLKDGKYAEWTVTPPYFVVGQHRGNAAAHLIRNAFGGSDIELYRTCMSAYPPMCRNVRDDVTVQVIFFGEV